MSSNRRLWRRFQKYYLEAGGLGLDVSRMGFPGNYLDKMRDAIRAAFDEMKALEAGAIANPDENRRVGHYWLRDPGLADDEQIEKQITTMQEQVRTFVGKVHEGADGHRPQHAAKFTHFLLIGIGGSALGPQFVADALRSPGDRMAPHFFDNTDPDGMQRVLDEIGEELDRTLAVIISKSGGTKETRNGMLVARAACEAKGLDFLEHAVVVTGEGSKLHALPADENWGGDWLAMFPMWDWVGGRTSVTSAAGYLPMLLQGIDADALLEGAAAMDEATREPDPLKNPAMLLALMWHHAGNGRGEKAMVVLPYKDRLVLFSRYLQQLVMESLGKELDRAGRVVSQGIAVYGNKGSTDQHAYVQQLRDGRNDFFVTFIEVLKDRCGPPRQPDDERIDPAEVAVDRIDAGLDEPVRVRPGDYLEGFLLGTRRALHESQRESITITLPDVSPASVGRLIALFERAVGFYASLVNINAYHQPGVEAGKKAAVKVLVLQTRALAFLERHRGCRYAADGLAAAMNEEETPRSIGAGAFEPDPETLFQILRRLAVNGDVKCDQLEEDAGRIPRPDAMFWVE